jgi:hypothetical protein
MTSPLKIVLLAVCAMAIGGCGSPYYTVDPIEAWVVDADTGQPLEGAVVTANWQLVSPGLDTGGRKLHQLEVMETLTDKNGRFHFPGFTKLNPRLLELRDEDPQILIFKSRYGYFRTSNNYPADKGSPGAHRSSPINRQTLRMAKADPDVRKYAFDLGFLTTSLMNIWDSGNIEQTSRMVHALVCEQRRLRAIDSKAGFSIPGATGMEADCVSI